VSQAEGASSVYRGTVLQLARPTSLQGASPAKAGDLLFGNQALMSGHETVVRYSGMGFQAFFEALCMDYRGQVCPQAFDRAWRPVEGTGQPLVDLLGVQTLVIDARLFPGPAAARPPAGWSVAARDDIRTVWVRDAATGYGGRVSWASPGVQVRSDSASDATEQVAYRATGDGRLLFARLAWPGYTATVDGRPVAVRGGPAGLAVVDVPAGDHVLQLRFRPPFLRFGTAALVVAAAVVVLQTVLGLALGWRRRRRAAVPAAGGPGPEAPPELDGRPQGDPAPAVAER
jgi:hypothetical protein